MKGRGWEEENMGLKKEEYQRIRVSYEGKNRALEEESMVCKERKGRGWEETQKRTVEAGRGRLGSAEAERKLGRG